MRNKLTQKTKKAFSLIEVIFVLVILGIVASISSQIIVQVYENYIMQRATYNVSTKTELAVNQIVNRLSYRIQGTTISKRHKDFVDGSAGANSWLKLEDVTTGTDYTTIEWIGYDNDSLAASATPNWSGIANYETNASVNGFDSPGSNLNAVATIMRNLSKTIKFPDGKVDLTNSKPAALLFAENNNFYNGDNTYNPLCMGLIPEDGNSSTDCIFRVQQNGNTGFSFLDGKPKIITERYKLAWSAYALVPERQDNGQFDLILHSNYQPWNGESYMDTNTTRNTLLKNITVFKFSETGGVINFKLCASENIGQDFNITTCKQKVVIR